VLALLRHTVDENNLTLPRLKPHPLELGSTLIGYTHAGRGFASTAQLFIRCTNCLSSVTEWQWMTTPPMFMCHTKQLSPTQVHWVGTQDCASPLWVAIHAFQSVFLFLCYSLQ